MTKKQKKVLVRIIVAAVLLIILHFVPLEGIWLGLLYLIPYAVIGYDILRKAVLGIMHGEVFDENFLMAVATVGAMGLGEYSEGVAVMLFYQIGELFQAVAVGKSRQNISALMDIRPDYANIEAEDGSLEQVDPDDVEIGTVIVVRPGEKVPIDGVVVEGTSTLNTSALTGESVPREITVDQDVISGCVNLTGLLKIRTTKEFGESTVSKILDLVENSSMKKSKSENFITKFARYYTPAVCYSALALAILPPVINLIMGNPAAWSTWIIRALTFLVISCPCALVISIPLSFFGGIGAASACGILVKGSNYLEAMSETKYVVFDKTGTLTQNKMTVVEHTGPLPLLAAAMTLCNDAILEDGGAQGEPTEAALVNFAAASGCPKPQLEAQQPRCAEAPFDSSRKMMSTIHRTDGGFVQYTKGAPDEVLRRCTHYTEGGAVLPMTEEKRAAILADNKAMADKALRVLAAAERRYDSLPEDLTPQALEQQLCFIGLAGMIDPVRPEVKDAVAQCRAAGIRPVMITGDHKDTAVAIARELGIITDASQAVTGSALDGLSDDELDQVIDRYGVYARVQPEHKVRIVNAWRRRGAVTAMTGDGVNDAPSIKCADIGVGMGITGTDVTKNVADMVLSDDNFATIVSAVGEGRRIYDNIRKAIQFLLASNMSEVLGVFFATLLGFTLLNPVHLLFINLITDCFPALALGLEQAEPDTMTRPPRDSRDGVFAGGLGVDLAYQGVLITLITLVSYIIGHCMEVGYFEMPKGVSDDGMTMAFLTMSMCEIFHSFNMRSQRKSVFSLPSHNKVLWAAMAGSLVLTTAVLEVPVLANAFGFTPVSWPEYGIALALAFLVIPVVELVKLCQRRAAARRAQK